MKIAIVTGASSGMGREAVYQLSARYGGLSEIWVVARRENRLQELSGQVPVKIRPFALDITKKEDLAVLKKALRERNPQVKFLINAAGFGKTGLEASMDENTSLGMIRLNDEALVAVTRLVLPYCCENSRILQFASAAAFMPQPGFAVYAATKSFVLSYSRALNEELKRSGRSVAVTAVCPGPVDTEFFGIAMDGRRLAFYKRLVMMKPKRVVSQALRDAAAKKAVSVPGITMKLFRILCFILPHGLLMKFISWQED